MEGHIERVNRKIIVPIPGYPLMQECTYGFVDTMVEIHLKEALNFSLKETLSIFNELSYVHKDEAIKSFYDDVGSLIQESFEVFYYELADELGNKFGVYCPSYSELESASVGCYTKIVPILEVFIMNTELGHYTDITHIFCTNNDDRSILIELVEEP